MTATTSPADRSAAPDAPRKTDVIDTIQSLIVAFVVAMTFRGFVLEGFMIPTGSMGPTLLGAHILVRSPVTGYAYVADSMALDGRAKQAIIDPMITRRWPVEIVPRETLTSRAAVGDRVLVLKYLWPFIGPERWDVVVFKNPPDPVGETQNYIKRLVGMPDESLQLVDGDVFVGPRGAPSDQLKIARKPIMVQRAVWQPVYDIDWAPVDLARWEQNWKQAWGGPPWKSASPGWEFGPDRAWRHDGRSGAGGRAALAWDLATYPITDWNSYNVWRSALEFPVSDVRVAASIEADDLSSISSLLLLRTRGHRFEFVLGEGRATLRVIRHEDGLEVASATAAHRLDGRFARVECWHVDQTMRLFVDDREVVSLEYDFGPPIRRLELAAVNLDRYRIDPLSSAPQGASELKWSFDGGAVALRHLRVDRDLYYQPAVQGPHNQTSTNGSFIPGLGFGCDLDRPAQLDPDRYLMLGDNSAASRDGRVWGRPHPLLKRVFDFDAPFVVPRQLLVGKAWAVYFPATEKLAGGVDGAWGEDKLRALPALAPNFGRLRYIR